MPCFAFTYDTRLLGSGLWLSLAKDTCSNDPKHPTLSDVEQDFVERLRIYSCELRGSPHVWQTHSPRARSRAVLLGPGADIVSIRDGSKIRDDLENCRENFGRGWGRQRTTTNDDAVEKAGPGWVGSRWRSGRGRPSVRQPLQDARNQRRGPLAFDGRPPLLISAAISAVSFAGCCYDWRAGSGG